MTTVNQVHSAVVIEAFGPGGERIAEGDALISREPGMTVGIRTADCVPILLADARTHAVAAIHAGWRGTAQNIVNATIRALITRYGTRPGDLHAAIGPAIGACCYEVGPDVARQFGTWFPSLENAQGPTQIDLASINEIQLVASGTEDIWKANECTFCDAGPYSSHSAARRNRRANVVVHRRR